MDSTGGSDPDEAAQYIIDKANGIAPIDTAIPSSMNHNDSNDIAASDAIMSKSLHHIRSFVHLHDEPYSGIPYHFGCIIDS